MLLGHQDLVRQIHTMVVQDSQQLQLDNAVQQPDFCVCGYCRELPEMLSVCYFMQIINCTVEPGYKKNPIIRTQFRYPEIWNLHYNTPEHIFDFPSLFLYPGSTVICNHSLYITCLLLAHIVIGRRHGQ